MTARGKEFSLRLLLKLAATFAMVAILVVAQPGTAEASLIGDTVDCAITGGFTCQPGSAVVGDGREFEIGSGFVVLYVDLGASSILINSRPFTAVGFGSGPSTLTFSSLFGPNEFITGFSLTTTAVPGLTASDITVTEHSVVIDLRSTSWSGSSNSSANITLQTATAPEPASMLLLGTGLLGAGVRRWRHKRT